MTVEIEKDQAVTSLLLLNDKGDPNEIEKVDFIIDPFLIRFGSDERTALCESFKNRAIDSVMTWPIIHRILKDNSLQ